MTNSIGLIDAGYRGEIQAKMDILDWKNKVEPEYLILEKGTRLFQICRHDFLPWDRIIIEDGDLPLAPDDRGINGFGSTDYVGRGY